MWNDGDRITFLTMILGVVVCIIAVAFAPWGLIAFPLGAYWTVRHGIKLRRRLKRHNTAMSNRL